MKKIFITFFAALSLVACTEMREKVIHNEKIQLNDSTEWSTFDNNHFLFQYPSNWIVKNYVETPFTRFDPFLVLISPETQQELEEFYKSGTEGIEMVNSNMDVYFCLRVEDCSFALSEGSYDNLKEFVYGQQNEMKLLDEIHFGMDSGYILEDQTWFHLHIAVERPEGIYLFTFQQQRDAFKNDSVVSKIISTLKFR